MKISNVTTALELVTALLVVLLEPHSVKGASEGTIHSVRIEFVLGVLVRAWHLVLGMLFPSLGEETASFATECLIDTSRAVTKLAKEGGRRTPRFLQLLYISSKIPGYFMSLPTTMLPSCIENSLLALGRNVLLFSDSSTIPDHSSGVARASNAAQCESDNVRENLNVRCYDPLDRCHTLIFSQNVFQRISVQRMGNIAATGAVACSRIAKKKPNCSRLNGMSLAFDLYNEGSTGRKPRKRARLDDGETNFQLDSEKARYDQPLYRFFGLEENAGLEDLRRKIL